MTLKNKIFLTLTAVFIITSNALSQDIIGSVKNGDVEKVKALIHDNHNAVNIRDNRQCTPLHFAAEAGCNDITELLINKGVEIDAVDINKNTPLHYAIMNGRADIVTILLKYGADKNAQNKDLNTPLHLAGWYKQKSIIEILVENGAEIDLKEYRGATPLMMLIWRMDDIDLVRLLLQYGADVNAKIERSWVSPLALAAQYGYRDIVNLLIDEGAVVDEKSHHLVRFSVAQGLDRLFKILTEKNADLNVGTNNGGTIVHFASEGGSPEILNILIEKGYECDEPDRYGWTPLHYAVQYGHSEAAEVLISKGIDVNAKTLSGKTSSNIAVERGYDTIARILTSHGADQSKQQFPVLNGRYFGQKPPGNKPEVFALGLISTPDGEHGSVTFSPDGERLFWTSEYKKSGSVGAFKVFSSHLENNRWTIPHYAFFTGKLLVEDDAPFVSPDGKMILFMSERSEHPDGNQVKERYYIIDKTETGWSEPKLLSDAVNRMTIRWQISVSQNGTLYFGSVDAGGKGASDIYLSRLIDGEYSQPENLGDMLNSEYNESAPFIAPDESYMIWGRDRNPDGFGMSDLYISFSDGNGNWSKAKNMGETINTGAPENCAYVSPDGNYLFFNSGRNGNYDIYWVNAEIIETLKSEE